MTDIDLFDSYTLGTLPPQQRAAFEARLEHDKELNEDYRLYRLALSGIFREGRQDDRDFAQALGALTTGEMEEVVGPRRSAPAPARTLLHFRPWMMQAASVAILLGVAIPVMIHMHSSSLRDVDNAIVAFQDTEIVTRGAQQPLNVKAMDPRQLRENIPALVNAYRHSDDPDQLADNGYSLAMAYLKLHARARARGILNELTARFAKDPDYAGFVEKCNSVLKLID